MAQSKFFYRINFEKDLGIWITSSLKPSLCCDKAPVNATNFWDYLKECFQLFLKSYIHFPIQYLCMTLSEILHSTVMPVFSLGYCYFKKL